MIIPTYNERETIGTVVTGLQSVFQKQGFEGEIIVVDDGSPDGTADTARALGVTVIERKGKLGLSSAVLAGFKQAAGDVLGVIDGDGSHPPALVGKLWKALDGADMVIGSRYVTGGGVRNWPRTRQIVSKVATWLARPVTTVRDPLSGFFLVRKKAIEGKHLKVNGFKIGLEIAVTGNCQRIVEVPFVFTDRKAGKSKMGWKEIVAYLQQLCRLYTVKNMRN